MDLYEILDYIQYGLIILLLISIFIFVIFMIVYTKKDYKLKKEMIELEKKQMAKNPDENIFPLPWSDDKPRDSKGRFLKRK